MAITLEKAEEELSILLKKEKLCIFAGSGVSVNSPSSLPTWDGFIDKYKEICKKLCKLNNLDNFDNIINDVDDFKKHDLLATITALRDIVANFENNDVSKSYYNKQMLKLFANREYNNYHKAIVNTNYKYILTTNYDTLLEDVADDNEYYDLFKRCYNHDNINKISEAIYKNESAIIHMHGTFDNIRASEFILTKEDYKQIKDKNPGFRTLMNSIFLNYSILFVGYGSSDPHLEDIIDDINYSLKWNYSGCELELPHYYLLIKKERLSPIFDHIKDKNRTKVIPVDKYEDMLKLLERLQRKHPRQKHGGHIVPVTGIA